MSDLLKGNFKVKNAPSVKVEKDEPESALKDKFRAKAIENIGGSMVFVERKRMTWEPNDE